MNPDWFRVVVTLERKKISHRKLAAILGCDKKQVGRFKMGKIEPRYSQGVKMLELAQ
jgi:DNA-binding Xre family transcriptional regulator